MDCETFDKLVVDRIFSELDDLASGSVQRHVAHCSRCRSIESSLRATREVAVLPLLDSQAPFVDRVLAIERATRTQLSFRQRLSRTVSVLAGYAMRPQLGMSALLLLMIGSSLFLLRAQPGGHELVQITERGVPEGEIETPRENLPRVTSSPLAAVSNTQREPGTTRIEPPPSPDASSFSSVERVKASFAAGRYREAHEFAEQAIQQGGPDSATLALLSAMAIAKTRGCASALARFEALRTRYGRSSVGDEAAFRAAECHAELGSVSRAKPLYEQLRTSATWGARARQHLEALTNRVDPNDAGAAEPQ